jgi:putative ABC transport system permease protein
MKLAWLVGRNLLRNRRHLGLAALGVVVGIASLAFFLALGLGVRRVLLGEVFPADRLEVVPPRSGPLGGLLSGPSLDDAVAARLRARPEVRALYPKMKVAFPARGWGGGAMLGRDVAFELSGFIDGVDPALLRGEVLAPYSFEDFTENPGPACAGDNDCRAPEFCAADVHRCQRPVPALVSRYLLELYDGSIAHAHGWPRIGEWIASRFRGTVFSIELGRSFFGDAARRGGPRTVRAQLVGVSDKAIPLGITVPLPYVKRWNRELAGEREAERYSSIVVRARGKDDITPLVAFVAALGFDQVESEAQRVGLFVTLVTLVLGLMSAAIVGVAALNVAHTYLMVVAERRREIALLRALGARRRDVRALLLGEAAVVGVAGGLAGVLLAIGAAAACDVLARRVLPDFPFRPDTYFHFSALLCAAEVAFAVACCLLGALFPANRAARLDPAAALGTT